MPTIRVLEEALAKTPPSVPRLRVLPANLPRAKLFPSIPPIKLWNVPPVEVPFEKESLEWAAREGERKQAAIVTRDATLAMLEEIRAERRLARRTFWVIVATFGVSSASLALSLVILFWA